MSKDRKRGTNKPLPFLGGSFGANQQRGGRGGSTDGRTARTATPFPGLTPGQSVVPGSIDVPNESYSWTSGKTPESAWWSHGEMGSTLPWIKALLNNSNVGGSLSQGYADVLATIISQLHNDQSAAINPDMVMSLFNNLLSYQTTQEQRGYDYMMLNESRQYNNPTNELGRYMGAGISRDAALQLLSGSAGNLGSGGGTAAAVQGPAAGAGAAALNSSNAHQNLVNNVFNGIQMIAGLVSQGLSVAQSVEQIRGMQMMNFMSSQQVQAYQNVNQVSELVQNLASTGAIDPAKMPNADEVFKFLLENQDNPNIKPFFDNGSIQRCFGNTMQRGMFNNHWNEVNRSRTDGEILDQFIRQNYANIAIAELQPTYIAAEMENLNYENLKLDAETLQYFQNMSESSARIRLMDSQGRLLRWQAGNEKLSYELNEAGFPMMKQNRIDELTLQAQKWNVLFGRGNFANIKVKGADGVERTPLENEILTWLREGNNAADALYLKNLYNSAIGSFATRYPSLYKLCTLFDSFGIFRYVADSFQSNANQSLNRQTSTLNAVVGTDIQL